MALTIPLQPEIEARFRAEAAREGLPVEQLAARRLEEAELLWRIRTAAPEAETKELHRLLRRREAGTLTASEREQLLTILDEREQRAAQRMEDLAQLSRLSNTPVRLLMEQLNIRPIAIVGCT
jgi:hypothetical protein